MPQFDVEYYFAQIFWLIIIFFAFYWILKKGILPKFERILEARSQKVEALFSKAKDLCKIFGSKELLYVELDAVRYVDGDSFDGGEGVCRNRGEWIGGMYVYVECLKLWPGMERKRL